MAAAAQRAWCSTLSTALWRVSRIWENLSAPMLPREGTPCGGSCGTSCVSAFTCVFTPTIGFAIATNSGACVTPERRSRTALNFVRMVYQSELRSGVDRKMLRLNSSSV
jgi:hypothetical protein